MLRRKIYSYLNGELLSESLMFLEFDGDTKNHSFTEKASEFNELKIDRLVISEKSTLKFKAQDVNGKLEYSVVKDEGKINLDFISAFRNVRRLGIVLENPMNYDDLIGIDSNLLAYFGLTQKKVHSSSATKLFTTLENFTGLDKLSLNFPKGKLITNIGSKFKKLRCLWLAGLNQKSTLNFSELTNLEYLNLFCETVLQYDLHTLKSLRALELYNCLKDDNVDYISEMENLEAISIGSFRSLKRLPDFSKLKKLKSISLYNCNQLEDFTPLLNCPSLEFIGLDGFPKDFDLTKVYCLADLPNLKKFGSFGNRGFVLKPHLPEAVKLNEVFHGKYSPDFEHFFFYYLAEKPEDSYMQDFGNGNSPVG